MEAWSVLKDAASTSIYGTRAEWGVVLITTKTGKRGGEKMNISYSNNFSWNTPTVTPEIAPAAEGAEMALKAMKRATPGQTSFAVVGLWYDDAAIAKMRDWSNKYGNMNLDDEMVPGRDFDVVGSAIYAYRSWDARKKFVRQWTPQQTHNLTISGSNGKTAYNLGVGYLGQMGSLKANPDEFNRYNINLGVTSSVTSWLELRSKVILSKAVRTTPYLYSSDVYDPWYYVTRWQAFYPYGTYQGKPFRSALTEVAQASMTPQESTLGRIQLGGTLKLAKGLTLDADYVYASTNGHERQTGGSVTAYNFWAFNGLNYSTYTTPLYDRAVYMSDWNERSAGKLALTYNKSLGDHEFKALLGTDAELYQYWSQRSERRTLMNPSQGEPNLATGDQFIGSSHGHWSTLGYVGRINYAYKGKYLFEANGRYDGSSNFPVNNRWAFFPSFSAGYVISKESFMNFSQPVLSFLKFRGSWGSVGNQAVGSNRFLSTLSSTSSNWLINANNMLTVTTPGLVSPNLSWERVSTLDLGVDARLFNSDFGVSFDWYRRTTSDMITAGVTVPNSLGTSAPSMNFGEMQTTGWELTLDWNHRFNNGINLNITGVLSDFKEVITKFSNTTKGINTNYEGKVLGEIWGFETDRFFTKDDFEADAGGNLIIQNGKYVMKSGVPTQRRWEESWFFYGPGDVKYRDLNGDGKVDIGTNTVGDAGDQRVIGNTTPRYQYGLRIGAEWKGFDINFYIQGVGQRDFWANGPVAIPGFRTGEGWYKHQLDYWTPENPNAFYPRPTDQGQSNNTRNFLPQTKYLLNMAYTRLKNLNIGYTLPAKWVKKAGLSSARIFASAENLLTFDHLSVPIDPEIDYTVPGLNDLSTFGRVYPYHISFAFGIQVTL